MKAKVLFTIFACAIIVACLNFCSGNDDNYHIEGYTSIDRLRGDTLYLQVFSETGLKPIDSCVVRGTEFNFSGFRENAEMAVITLRGQILLPIVLDGMQLEARLESQLSKVGGSALNDSLYNFMCAKNHVDSLTMAQQRNFSALIMDGVDYDEALCIVNAETSRLALESERMTIQFIKRNISNPLGTGTFAFVTIDYPYPILTPQIEEVLVDAGNYFRTNDYVSKYLTVAEDNMVRTRAGMTPNLMK